MKEVTKEELKTFPIRGYEGKVFVFNDIQEVKDQIVNDILSSPLLGVDTETKPSFKKGVINKVSLLQVATENAVYLFRLKKMGLPNFIVEAFNNKNVIKSGIAVGDDMADLQKLNGNLKPHNVIDLNIEAKRKGFVSIGAKKLSALCLGFTVSKRQQVSNWEALELSDAQIKYAATDAWISLEIYKKLLA